MDSETVWYRRCGAGWIAYRGQQAIWETVTAAELAEWFRSQGITGAVYLPLWIARF